MSTFTERGEGSKAWWLNMVQLHGSEGSSNITANCMHKQFIVYCRLGELESEGLASKLGPSGKGRRPKWSITVKGIKYLKDHQYELEDVEKPNDIPVDDTRALQRTIEVSSKFKKGYRVEQADENEDIMISNSNIEVDLPQKPAYFLDRMGYALHLLLTEKFADRVTAPELIAKVKELEGTSHNGPTR